MGVKRDSGFLSFFLVFFLTWSALATGAYPCFPVATPPAIDGQINAWDGAVSDKCWREAVWGNRFLSPGENVEAAEQTRFALSYDAKNLYLGIIGEFDPKNGVSQAARKHIWENESAELFLQVGNSSNMLHLLADVTGKNLLILNENRKTLEVFGGKIAVKVKKDSWELEAAIPLDLIGGVDSLREKQVRFNVTRSRVTAKQKQPVLSTWAYLPKPSFMQPGSFISVNTNPVKDGSDRMAAPLPDGIKIQKQKTKTRTFLYDLSEDKSMYRGKEGITEQAAPPPPSNGFIIANPIAGKPLRALFLLEVAARDVWELRERFQLECADYILFGTPYGSGNNQQAFAYNADQVEANLTGNGKKYDVIFVGCSINNEALYNAVKAQIKEGTGLVIFSPRGSGKHNDLIADKDLVPATEPLETFGEHPVLKNFALEGLAHTSSDPKTLAGSDGKIIRTVGFGQYGKGRIVHFGELARWTEGVLPYPIYDQNFYFNQTFPEWYEQIFSLIIRGMCWAGRLELAAFPAEAYRDGNVIRIPLPVKHSAEPWKLHIRWDSRFHKIAPSDLDLKGNEKEIMVSIPAEVLNSAGIRNAVLCHFVLKEKKSGKTLNWGSVAVENPSLVSIKRFKASKRYYAPGEKPDFRVTLSQIEKGFILNAWISDDEGRIIDRKTVKADCAKLCFSMDLYRALSNHLTAWISLQDAKGFILDCRRTELYLPQKTPLFKDGDFQLSVLGGVIYYREYFAPALRQLLKESGIRTVVPEQWNALFHTNENIFWSKAGKANQRITCAFRRKDLVSKISESIAEGLEKKLKTDMGAVTMTDEGALSGKGGGHGVNGDASDADFCYCPACFEEFRKEIRKQYSDLNSANKQWGTSFQSWQDVKPVPIAEIRKREDNNFSLWVDYKFFMEKVYLNHYLWFRDELAGNYPGIPVGLTNPGYLGQRTLLSGENYALWGPEETLQLKYFGLVNAIAYHSFRRKTVPRITWWGYMSDMDLVRAEPWWAAFNKINICTWWQIGGYANSSNPLWSANQLYTPELAHTKRSLEAGKYAKPLLDGIGKMVLDLPYTPAQIAFYYSQSSMYVSGVLQKHDNYYFRSEANWRNLLMNGNWRYDYIAGTAGLAKYKLLVLPYSISLSAEEQEKMIEFVKNGGIILADERPGFYDGHGKPEKGALWQLFKKTSLKQMKESGMKIYTRELGKGKLILTGRVIPFNQQTTSGITALLKKEKVPRYAWLNSPKQVDYDIYSFAEGELLGIGMVGRYSGQKRCIGSESVPSNGTLHFNKKYHIYDVKRGTYLGFHDKITKEFRPDHGEFYVLLNQKAGVLQGSAAYDSKDHAIRYSGTVPGRRLIQVTVKDQFGEDRDFYSGKVWSSNGTFRGSFPLGFNEKDQTFTIEFRDVLTNQKITGGISK